METDAQEILARFDQDGDVPRLTAEEQVKASAYLADMAMVPVFGSVDIRPDEYAEDDTEQAHPLPLPVKLVLSHESNYQRYLNMPGAILGPHIMSGEYHPRGISVYVPR